MEEDIEEDQELYENCTYENRYVTTNQPRYITMRDKMCPTCTIKGNSKCHCREPRSETVYVNMDQLGRENREKIETIRKTALDKKISKQSHENFHIYDEPSQIVDPKPGCCCVVS